MDAVIARLRDAVERPLTHAAAYSRMGLAPPAGVLLYGPPGTSKTTLARALAQSVHASFHALSGADVLSAYVGDAEAAIRAAFLQARRAAPAILFLDEVDALVGSRGIGAGAGTGRNATTGVLATLLAEMDGVTGAGPGLAPQGHPPGDASGGLAIPRVIVVAATNRPEALDPALLRPGRLEVHIHVPPPPDARSRAEVLRVHTRRMPLAGDVDLESLAADPRISGWSGAQLENICREAAMEALRECLRARADGVAGATAAGKVELGVPEGGGKAREEEGGRADSALVSARHFAAAMVTLAGTGTAA